MFSLIIRYGPAIYTYLHALVDRVSGCGRQRKPAHHVVSPDKKRSHFPVLVPVRLGPHACISQPGLYTAQQENYFNTDNL